VGKLRVPRELLISDKLLVTSGAERESWGHIFDVTTAGVG